jgi:hypothetical protein
MSNKDMDNINYSKIHSIKIYKVLGIPNELMGDAEGKTYNNYKEAKSAFYKDTVLAYAQRIVDNWNAWLAPHYYLEGGKKIYIEVNKEAIEALREDVDGLSVRTLEQYTKGIITRAEAREMLGWTFTELDNVYKVAMSDVFIDKLTGEATTFQNYMQSQVLEEQTKSINNGIELKKKVLTVSVINEVLNTMKAEDYYDDVIGMYEKILKEECNGKVLDAGCGYGRWSVLFDNYVGVDFSPDFIELAKKEYPNKTFIQGDLKALPFKDGEFDSAFCVSIKQMIEGNLGKDVWLEMEKEILRVSKKLVVLEYTDPENYNVLRTTHN